MGFTTKCIAEVKNSSFSGFAPMSAMSEVAELFPGPGLRGSKVPFIGDKIYKRKTCKRVNILSGIECRPNMTT
jgi:hypothetical protein